MIDRMLGSEEMEVLKFVFVIRCVFVNDKANSQLRWFWPIVRSLMTLSVSAHEMIPVEGTARIHGVSKITKLLHLDWKLWFTLSNIEQTWKRLLTLGPIMKSQPIRFANPIATIVTAETQDKNGERRCTLLQRN